MIKQSKSLDQSLLHCLIFSTATIICLALSNS